MTFCSLETGLNFLNEFDGYLKMMKRIFSFEQERNRGHLISDTADALQLGGPSGLIPEGPYIYSYRFGSSGYDFNYRKTLIFIMLGLHEMFNPHF